MTTEELKKELYEETLAQMFDKFSENRKDKYTKGVIRSFFEFLADLIKNIIDYIRGNKVDILFRDIDMGRYSTTRIANNKGKKNEDVELYMGPCVGKARRPLRSSPQPPPTRPGPRAQ